MFPFKVFNDYDYLLTNTYAVYETVISIFKQIILLVLGSGKLIGTLKRLISRESKEDPFGIEKSENFTKKVTENCRSTDYNKKLCRYIFYFIYFLFSLFTETENPVKLTIVQPWIPQYCVLQQDEQTLTAYCSEELSVCYFKIV